MHTSWVPNWASDYIKSACVVDPRNFSPKVLGVRLGDETVCRADIKRIGEKDLDARGAVQDPDDPASELTLQWCCLNASK